MGTRLHSQAFQLHRWPHVAEGLHGNEATTSIGLSIRGDYCLLYDRTLWLVLLCLTHNSKRVSHDHQENVVKDQWSFLLEIDPQPLP